MAAKSRRNVVRKNSFWDGFLRADHSTRDILGRRRLKNPPFSLFYGHNSSDKFQDGDKT